MMRIANDFEIGQPPDMAFGFLVDLDRVAPCLPGAELGDESSGGGRELTVTVRLGPMRMVYEGEVSITDQDPTARRAVLAGSAREARGGGTGDAVIEMTVSGDGAGSQVATVAEVTLTGRAAQMGQGIVDDVARQMIGEMVNCIEARLAAEAPAGSPDDAKVDDSGPPSSPAPKAVQEIKGGALIWRVVVSKLKALFRRR